MPKSKKSKLREKVTPPRIGVKKEPYNEVLLTDMAEGEVGVTEEGLYYYRTPTTLTYLNLPNQTYTMDSDDEIPTETVSVFLPGTVLELTVNTKRPNNWDDEDEC